jgi:hypothetical protein
MLDTGEVTVGITAVLMLQADDAPIRLVTQREGVDP